MIAIAPDYVSATVYGCPINYPPEVEERYWAAVDRYDLYPSGDELCTITVLGGSDLGEFEGTDPKKLAQRLMADFGGLWRVSGNETLQPVSKLDHPNGSSYWRFREQIDGHSVLNGGVIVETATASGKIRSFRARFLPDFNLIREPIIDASDAVEHVHAALEAGERSLPPPESTLKPALSWYFMSDVARLVWEIDVPDISEDGARSRYLVDALNGDILRGVNQNRGPAVTCGDPVCQQNTGVHQFSWSPSANAEYYELSCAKDPEFVTGVATMYVGQLTEVVEPVVTDTWCRVRACNLEGCSVWAGSMYAAGWPDCGSCFCSSPNRESGSC